MSDIDKILRLAGEHARDEVAVNVASWIESRKWPRSASSKAGKLGLCGLYCPVELGGQGLSLADGIRVYEELGRADGAYAFALSMHNICAYAICGFGGDALKERWARLLTSGEKLANFSLTEPQSGSDAANILTSSERDSNGDYIISGTKAWVSLAGEADVYLVVATTPHAEGVKGAAMFAVDAESVGLSVSKIYDTASYNFLPIGELVLENVRVSESDIVLPPGQGLQGSLMAIDIARTSIASGCAGLIETALDRAVDYAYGRMMFGRRQLDLETIQWMLADIYNDLAIVRLLYRDAAGKLGSDGGRVAAAHAKLFAPDAALRAASVCTQVMGGVGLFVGSDMARLTLLGQMLKVVDGTTEIQRVVLGRELYSQAKKRNK